MNRELRKAAKNVLSIPETDSSGQSFVIQKHHASHLHYDFRLEMKDPETGKKTLISWAIPKNLPTIPGVKHLAIRVENHDVEYLTFEGEISEGKYGAGEVEIWDKGKWGLMKGDLLTGRLSFNLFGEKLKGRYQMILTKDLGKKKESSPEDKKWKHWLVWKREAGSFF